MGMSWRKAAAGDDSSQTKERRQWFSFSAMRKAKELEKDDEVLASPEVATATTKHPILWRLRGLRPMSGVMVLPYRSWHTTGWRRQVPEDRATPADSSSSSSSSSSSKRTQATFLRQNAEACLLVALVLVFALCAWRWYKGKLPARQARVAEEAAVAANLRDEEEGQRDPPPPIAIRGPEGGAVAGAAVAVVSRPAVLNQAVEDVEEGPAAEAPAIVANANDDGRRGRQVPSPTIGRGGLQGEAQVRSPPVPVGVPGGGGRSAAVVAATPRHAGPNRFLEDGVQEVERVAGVRMPITAAIDVVPCPAVPLGGVHQAGEARPSGGFIGDNRGREERGRQAAVDLVPTLGRGEDFDLSHLPAGLGDVEQGGGAGLPTGLSEYLGEEEKVEGEASVAEGPIPAIAAPGVIASPTVPLGGAHQGGEAFLPAGLTGYNDGAGEEERWQPAMGLMPTFAADTSEVRHGVQADTSHLPAGHGDVEQGGGAVLPTGLFGYLEEEEEKVEEEASVAESPIPTIAAPHVIASPTVPPGDAHQGGEAFLPAGLVGYSDGAGEEEGWQPAMGLMPTLAADTSEVRHGVQADTSHLPAGHGDVEQGGGAVLPTGLFGYLGEEEEKVEEEASVAESPIPTIAAPHVIASPAVPLGDDHQEGGGVLPAGLVGYSDGAGEEERWQPAMGLMPTFPANAREVHHGSEVDTSHLPAGLGDVEQGGGAVLPTGLFGYLGEEEEKVEEEVSVAGGPIPIIAATGVITSPAVPFGGVHQEGGGVLPAGFVGYGDGGGEEEGWQPAVGLMPTFPANAREVHHGSEVDTSHLPAGLGDVEQGGGAVLPTGLFGYLGEEEEKVEEEASVAESPIPTIAATGVITSPAVPFGGVHQEGGGVLPADLIAYSDGAGEEEGWQPAVGLMPMLAADTSEVRHGPEVDTSHLPAGFGNLEQGVGTAVLPTDLFGYIGEDEEKREVVDSAHTPAVTTGHAGQERGTLLPAGLLGSLGGAEGREAAPRGSPSSETRHQHVEEWQHGPIMRRERLPAGNERVRHRESAAGWWMAEEKGSYAATAGFSRTQSKARDERFLGAVCSEGTIGATADRGMQAGATELEGRATMRAEGRVDVFDPGLEVKGKGVERHEHLWNTLEAKAEGKGPSVARVRDSGDATTSMALETKAEGKGAELEPVEGAQAFPRGVRAEGEALPCIPEGRSAAVAGGGLPSTAGPGDEPLVRAPSVVQTGRADEQTGQASQAALTSLSRQVREGWRQRGSIRRLFLANLAEVSASDQVQSFAINALKTAVMPMTLAQPLGYGSFGRVDDVSYTSLPGQSFAMKTVTQAASLSARFCALVEMTVFARLARNPHRNVLGALSMDDDSDLMPILLPKARCDLGSYLNTDTHGLGDKLRLVVDLARGVQHMHSMGLVHKDIKPGNVLVFESEEHGLHAKLADFGFTGKFGESCPGGTGTAGAMAFEAMTADPVIGAPAQDVVSVAVVLIKACLRKEWRCSNLFTQQVLTTAGETARLEVLLERTRLGQDVSHDIKLLEFEVSRRTMADGSFMAWLSPDKLDLTLESAEKLVGVLPSLLAVDPESREDMDFLVQLTSHLAEVNESAAQPAEEPWRGG